MKAHGGNVKRTEITRHYLHTNGFTVILFPIPWVFSYTENIPHAYLHYFIGQLKRQIGESLAHEEHPEVRGYGWKSNTYKSNMESHSALLVDIVINGNAASVSSLYPNCERVECNENKQHPTTAHKNTLFGSISGDESEFS